MGILSDRYDRLPLLLLVGLLVVVCAGSALAQPSPAPNQQGVEVFNDPFASGSDTSGGPSVELWDPIRPWNVRVSEFNRDVYEFGKPPLRLYRDYTPLGLRESIRNFFHNLYEPSYVINSLLQGRWYDSTVAGRRFIINSTFGGLGFFDPAGEHLDPVERPFDQTLGVWGLDPGPYIVWPFLGPSSARGTVGLVGDMFMDPTYYVNDVDGMVVVTGVRIVNDASFRLDQFESLERYTVDPYSAIKNYYERQLERRSRE